MRKVKKGRAASHSNCELAKHDLEDISEAKKATFEELVSLYDGASAAAYAWNGAITQPRSGEDLVGEVMAAQYDRCFHLMKGVAAELYRRATEPPLRKTPIECARVLLDWYHVGGEDNPEMLRMARMLCEDKHARSEAIAA